MSKSIMFTPRELKALYEQGQNINAILRKEANVAGNSEPMIEVSYDLQTGSYIDAMADPGIARHKSEYSREIAGTIRSLCQPGSLLEAGVGEATTLSGVVQALGQEKLEVYGFDLSWSRVAYGARWLKRQGIHNFTLCTGSFFQIPFSDNSVDVVYTSHSIEPNGGKEGPILEELYRVARRYLILLEPAYELATAEARARMEAHGYCRELKAKSEALGYKVIEHKLFAHSANPLNPTGLTIIEKETKNERPDHVLACPKFKTRLEKLGNVLFSEEALVAYPILEEIPCLRIENGIVASKYPSIHRDAL